MKRRQRTSQSVGSIDSSNNTKSAQRDENIKRRAVIVSALVVISVIIVIIVNISYNKNQISYSSFCYYCRTH